jgi:nucleoside-triphosphatase THEP1
LFSAKFRIAVERAVEGRKLVIGVVHWKARDRLIEEVKAREDAEVFVVTCENRDSLPKIIVGRAAEFLRRD